MKKLSVFALALVVLPALALAAAPAEPGVPARAQGKPEAVGAPVATGTASAASSSAPGQERAAEVRSVGAKASTTASTTGQSRAAEHRSAVATFVQALLETADRAWGVGSEVREVAQSQNDSASTTEAAMKAVEGRGGLKTFLVGTDWENVGALRSELARGSADVARLEAAKERATDPSVQADLEKQIEALKDTQADLQEFVEEHEGKFSLFGWLTKLF